MEKIAVIGAGTMGNGIAHVMAMYDYSVHLIDISDAMLSKGIASIEKNLERMVRKELIDSEKLAQTLKNISPGTDLEAASQCQLVIEAATENEALKSDIFARLDRLCLPDAILATNTSSISITRIASATSRPEKVIGMHFMNPVPVMKLVEVIRGYSTSEETAKLVSELARKIGKTPVEVNDYPGFVANRILMPMINEAMFALFENVGGVEEIDTIMKLGMGHPMGPLQLADFIGLDVCLSILEVMFRGFGNSKYAPCPLLAQMVQAGKLGVKTGEGFYSYAGGSGEKKVSRRFTG